MNLNTLKTDYERDLRTILYQAARSKIQKAISSDPFQQGYYFGMIEAYQIAALQILSRLVWIDSTHYVFACYTNREKYITLRINRLVIEKTIIT